MRPICWCFRWQAFFKLWKSRDDELRRTEYRLQDPHQPFWVSGPDSATSKEPPNHQIIIMLLRRCWYVLASYFTDWYIFESRWRPIVQDYELSSWWIAVTLWKCMKLQLPCTSLCTSSDAYSGWLYLHTSHSFASRLKRRLKKSFKRLSKHVNNFFCRLPISCIKDTHTHTSLLLGLCVHMDVFEHVRHSLYLCRESIVCNRRLYLSRSLVFVTLERGATSSLAR